jgi:hypothetical protein
MLSVIFSYKVRCSRLLYYTFQSCKKAAGITREEDLLYQSRTQSMPVRKVGEQAYSGYEIGLLHELERFKVGSI